MPGIVPRSPLLDPKAPVPGLPGTPNKGLASPGLTILPGPLPPSRGEAKAGPVGGSSCAGTLPSSPEFNDGRPRDEKLGTVN